MVSSSLPPFYHRAVKNPVAPGFTRERMKSIKSKGCWWERGVSALFAHAKRGIPGGRNSCLPRDDRIGGSRHNVASAPEPSARRSKSQQVSKNASSSSCVARYSGPPR
jgi:hypothetical protein